MLKDMELTVKQVQQNLKASQDRKKIYVDPKRTLGEFQVGEHVYIKVNPKKISLRLGRYSNFKPRYCGTFEILAKVGLVAYWLDVPSNVKVHNVFHVSILKKYIHDATHVIDCIVIQVDPEGDFQVGLECIIDRRELLLWNHTIGKVKVQWKHICLEESTWELESDMREVNPILFQDEIM